MYKFIIYTSRWHVYVCAEVERELKHSTQVKVQKQLWGFNKTISTMLCSKYISSTQACNTFIPSHITLITQFSILVLILLGWTSYGVNYVCPNISSHLTLLLFWVLNDLVNQHSFIIIQMKLLMAMANFDFLFNREFSFDRKCHRHLTEDNKIFFGGGKGFSKYMNIDALNCI